ncbi:hypothetical protein BASA81_006145 [Batrachochytrium salamandrivorans]|nr:hypothetical protein BASA81_006145 [Batrachochytrium salamandrivorans]
MELQQIDPVLEAFDRLRLREAKARYGDTASTFLTKFQSIAASLQPDEKIKLEVSYTHETMELLKAVLADPQANKICSLRWRYNGKEDVNPVLPLLINNCPELASLEVYFKHHSAFDFVSSVFDHPNNRIKVLDISPNTKDDLARFFAALGQSQVSALALSIGDSSEFYQGLYEYLAKDLLVRLKVWTNFEQVPPEMMVSLVDCTRLAELKLVECKFSQPTAFSHLPKSITTLTLDSCRFVGSLDWSFLADSNVRELDLYNVKGVDGNQLGSALALHLRAKGLDKLRFAYCGFVNETLAKVGVEIGRIKRLILAHSNLNDTSVELIALALQSPNSEMKELVLLYDYTATSIEDHLVPALKHSNCNLVKLSLHTDHHTEAAGRVEAMFHNRLALFVLLQARQVRRRSPCPLRRLPVEMFRLVGKVLI